MSQASTIATLLASTGSIVGGGAGIWWLTKTMNDSAILEQQESIDDMPQHRTLEKDQDFTVEQYKDKYGGLYGRYLIGIHSQSKDNTHSSINNDDWWNWAFKKHQLANTSQGKFAKITKATGNDGISLQQVCTDVYKKQKVNGSEGNIFQDIVAVGGSVGPDQYLETDIWRFCSVIGVKPKTLSETEETYSEGTNGAIENDRKVFLSVDARENVNFWKHQENRLKNSIDVNNDKFFSSKKDKSIKEICRDAYKIKVGGGDESSDHTTNLSLEIEKYCQLVNAVMKIDSGHSKK